MSSNKLKHNRIQCLHCDDVIESVHVHDFKWCECGRVAVDGGLDYAKRCFVEVGDYIDLSEWWDKEDLVKDE